jgi:very-short-patch-repair endonuclease
MRQISTFDSPEAIAGVMDREDVLAEMKKRKAKKPSKTKMAAADFGMQCLRYGLPQFEREWTFAKGITDLPELDRTQYPNGRRWRFDYAWPQYKVAVEIEGVVIMQMIDPRTRKLEWVSRGRHATPGGFREDVEKYTSAMYLGWTVLRFEQTMVKSEYAIRQTMRILCKRDWSGPNSGESNNVE